MGAASLSRAANGGFGSNLPVPGRGQAGLQSARLASCLALGEEPLTLMSEVNGRGSNQLFLPTGGFGIS